MTIKKHDQKLKLLRKQIDGLDRQIMMLLKNRFRIVVRIATLKKKLNLEAYQPSRWKSMLKERILKANKIGMHPRFAKLFFNLIHNESVRIQKSMRTKGTRNGK